MTTDSDLIVQSLDGQPAAFGELVRRHQDRLYTTMVHVVGCAEEARDVVQDAFVQAFVKLDSFQGASSFYTWLYRIAFNLAINHRRRRRPTISVDAVREQYGDEPVEEGADPTAHLEQQERVRHVHAALEALDDDHRAILTLRELEGCSYESIAEVLDVPIGTVRSRLFRARMQLREQLKQLMPEDSR